jgi:uncharacterized protein with PQ loop repeat
MISIDKTIYYYLILFAIFIYSFSLIPLIFEIIQQKITLNIPYSTLILMFISTLIFLFITISRQYYIHIFFYSLYLICISIIIFLKRKYDKKNKSIQFIDLYDS